MKKFQVLTFNRVLNVARISVDIANGFYESFSRQYADLVCNNLRPYVSESPAYSATSLRSTDGIRSEVTTIYKTSRGAIESGGIPYFVQGNQLISLDSLGAVTAYGTIAGSGRVSMAASQTLIWIVVPDGNSYHFNISTGTLTLNVDGGFLGPAIAVAFKDSFFFFCTNTIIFNANLDGITFTPTDFGTAEVNPDIIQTILELNGQFYALGTETIQPYQSVGGSGFPLATLNTATVNRGLASRFGVVKANNTFYFMGGGDQQEVSIWAFTGNSAIKVSTPAIDHFMQELGDAEIQGVFAWSYQTEGEEFIGFTFANRTFVYQVEASKKMGRHIWHERSTSGTRWRVNTVVRAYNRIYVGDERTEVIGIIDPSIFTEYGDTVEREFTTQPFSFKGAPAFASEYEMVMTTGVGNASSTNPVVNHSYSENGVNFTPSISRSMGLIGEYGHRVVWRRMGRISRDRVLKFQTNEPVETTFFAIEAEVSLGA